MMRPLRTTALALLLTACCGGVAAPAVAGAHEGHGHDPAVDALAQLAPDAVRGSCVRTIDVPGQGPSCRDDDAWLVDVPGPRDIPTHGPDAIAATELAPAELDGAAQAAVDGASVADVSCAANARVPRYKVIYAHPPQTFDEANIERLRLEVYRANAFLNAQAGPGRTAKLRVACGGAGTPTVYPIQVDAAPTFTSISAALPRPAQDSPVLERYLVFYDGQVPGLAGQGTWMRDQRASVDNASNVAGSVAINYATASSAPQWHVLLHEVLHTMGAVQDGADDASGQGHCSSDIDIMCYVDTANIPLVSLCTTLQADCNRDSYFNANEPTSGYLAGNWNVGHWRNRWLDHGADNRDVTAPSRPGTPVVSAISSTSLTLGWTSATDDHDVDRYRIEKLAGAWSHLGDTNQLVFARSSLSPGTPYTFRVVAIDAAGNESVSNTVTASTLPDSTPPSATPRPLVTGLSLRSVSVEWDPATDDVAIASYRVYRRTSTSQSSALATTVSASARAATLPTTAPGEPVLVTVAAVDASGNVGTPSLELSTRSITDLTRPTTPAITSAILTGTTLQLAWESATDNDAVAGYAIDYTLDGVLVPLAQLGPGARRHDVANLPKPRDIDVQLVAVDLAGNRSAPSIIHVRFPADPDTPVVPPASIGRVPDLPATGTGTGTGTIGTGTAGSVTGSIPRDIVAPTRPSALRITRRTSAGVRIAWRPAADAVGVTRYRILLLAASGRWVTHRTVPARAASGYLIPGLRPGRRYGIAVQALDAAGNTSARSGSVVASVPRRHPR